MLSLYPRSIYNNFLQEPTYINRGYRFLDEFDDTNYYPYIKKYTPLKRNLFDDIYNQIQYHFNDDQESESEDEFYDDSWNDLVQIPNLISKKIRKYGDDNRTNYYYQNTQKLNQYVDEDGNTHINEEFTINKNGQKQKILQQKVYDRNQNLISSDKKCIKGGDQKQIKEEEKQQQKGDSEQKQIQELNQTNKKNNKKTNKTQKKQKKLKNKIKKINKEKSKMYSSQDQSSPENQKNDVIIEDEMTGECQTFSSDSKE
ncbi:hypothetical protein PPERSA_08031 [Pseudocohnilembus persalinus]|uniref:Uncharacterized protein n=1 Tax=Pseudocohnilembus persalinus TaxID=266149 RepID=A0A0V0R344_PSEPJ|nr:hypothetical protein PPERSA_08031 [Pseudocohnilembus persalinus]|eukprot:KRX08720.1 hypothetical protein PPERSA_08031 [Pseudocohnilembus persalinus]